jgi:hypothetical protein
MTLKHDQGGKSAEPVYKDNPVPGGGYGRRVHLEGKIKV